MVILPIYSSTKRQSQRNTFLPWNFNYCLSYGFLFTFSLLATLWLINVPLQNQPQACNFIKKKTLVQVFSYEFCEISKNTFLTEYLRVTASQKCKTGYESIYHEFKKIATPVDTGRILNVYKTFKRRPRCLLNVL